MFGVPQLLLLQKVHWTFVLRLLRIYDEFVTTLRFIMIFKYLSALVLMVMLPNSGAAEVSSGYGPFQDQRNAAIHFMRPIFHTLDCEGVGIIEQGEVDEHFNQIFFFSDRDFSRSISKNEYINTARRNSVAEDEFIFEVMDSDDDGTVSPREYRTHVLWAIDAADANADGELSEDEIRTRAVGGKRKSKVGTR